MESLAPVDFEEVITDPSQEIAQPEPEPEPEGQLQIFVESEEADISDSDETIVPVVADNGLSFIADARTPEQFVPTPSANISFEITPQDVESAAAASDESNRAMLNEVLEPLEPEAAQTATELIDKAVGTLIEQGPAKEKPLFGGQDELEEVMVRLLTTLDIEFDDDSLKKLISSIQPEALQLPDNDTEQSNYESGTHERKMINYLIIRNLSLMMQTTPTYIIIGRYAVNHGAALLAKA